MAILLNVIPFPDTVRFEKVIGEAGQILYIRDNFRKQTYIIKGTVQSVEHMAKTWTDDMLSDWVAREMLKRELKS